MTRKNLAIVFAPNLLRTPPGYDSNKILSDAGKVTRFFEQLLDYEGWKVAAA